MPFEPSSAGVVADLAVIDGFHDVPAADDAGNVVMRDVIGNKEDAAAAGAVSTTESLMAYAKQIVTFQNAEALSIGQRQVSATTFDLAQAAASYVLFTGTSQVFMLTGLSFKMPNVDASDDAALTSIAIATDDVTPSVIISAVTGAVANLDAEAELSWTGLVRIEVGTEIEITIAGGAADEATVTDIVVEGYAVVAGGNLA